MQPLQLADFTEYRFLSNVELSPNGSAATFCLRKSKPEKDGYFSDLWLYRLNSGEMRQLTGMGDASSYIWLDDVTLLFTANREHKKEKPLEPETDFYKLRIDGGEAVKAFTVPLKVSEIQPLGGTRWLVSAMHDNMAPSLRGLEGKEREKTLKAHEEEQDYMVVDEIHFWSNGEGVTNKKRTRLYLFDTADGSITPITGELYNVQFAKINEAKDRLLYVGTEYSAKMEITDSLWVYDLTSKQAKELISGGKYQFALADFAGDQIVFAASECRKYSINENPTYSLVDMSGKITRFADPDLSLGSSVGSDCRLGGGNYYKVVKDGVYLIVTDRNCSRLCKLSFTGEIHYVSEAEGSVDCFDLRGEACLFVGMKAQGLQELYQLDLHTLAETKITSFNEDVLKDKYVAVPEPHHFVNQDGVEIDGWVLLPKDYDANKTYPAILEIHGGPKTVYGTVFYHELQLWANEGYFVMFCNPRGGDGRGDDFADIRGQYGGIDYADLMEFTDKVLAAYPAIDSSRVGVTGGSYGGFMTNWIIGHTDRFAAAVSQRSISNWVSMCCTTDIGYYFATDQTASTPWENIDKMWDQSPLKYADRCKTPTLFLHSDEDYRCWQAEALQMFTALKMHGVDSKLCMFKGENHELSRSGKPKHRIRRLKEMKEWFAHYLK